MVNKEDMFSVKIDPINDDWEVQDIKDAFGKFGDVQDVYIPRDRNTQRPRGFAFVRYEKEDEALDAVDESGKLEISGTPISISMAGKRPPPRSFGGRDNYGGRGGRRGDSRGRGRGGYGGGGRRDSRGRGGRDRSRGGRRGDSRRRR